MSFEIDYSKIIRLLNSVLSNCSLTIVIPWVYPTGPDVSNSNWCSLLSLMSYTTWVALAYIFTLVQSSWALLVVRFNVKKSPSHSRILELLENTHVVGSYLLLCFWTHVCHLDSFPVWMNSHIKWHPAYFHRVAAVGFREGYSVNLPPNQ